MSDSDSGGGFWIIALFIFIALVAYNEKDKKESPQGRAQTAHAQRDELAARKAEMSSQLAPLNNKMRSLTTFRDAIQGTLKRTRDIIKQFSARELELKKLCRQARDQCHITSFDEAALRTCEALSLPIRELNKIVSARRVLEKGLPAREQMLATANSLVESLDMDITMFVTSGRGNAEDTIRLIESFMKNSSVTSPDLAINDEALPPISLRETWKLIDGK